MRTEKGIIFRATENIEINKNIPQKYKKIIDEVVNHSKNIIDLIEVGDYVNGYKVIGVTLDPAPSGKCVDIDCDKPSYESYLFENEIKSILTKEQFNQNSYKVVE